jgi:NAD(P)-dependent dehydrogenase (short-subunit alcohol dehydrogenase family)
LVSDAGFLSSTYGVNTNGALFLTRGMLKNVAKRISMIKFSTTLACPPPRSRLSAYGTLKIWSAKLFAYLPLEKPGLRVFTLFPGTIDSAMHKRMVPKFAWLYEIDKLLRLTESSKFTMA